MWCGCVARTAASARLSHWPLYRALTTALRAAHTRARQSQKASVMLGARADTEKPRRRRTPSVAKGNKGKSQTGRQGDTSVAGTINSYSSSNVHKEDTDKERVLAEGDVRLAMRCLMTRHFAFESSRERPVREKERQQRAQRLAQLEPSMQRAEQKRLNSLRLMSDDAVSLGDGIVPFFSAGYEAPAAPAREGRWGVAVDAQQDASNDNSQSITNTNSSDDLCTHGKSAWNTLNPVGIAAMMRHQQRLQNRMKEDEEQNDAADDSMTGSEDGDTSEADIEAAYCQQLQQLSVKGWENVTLQSLCQPDLTMYDNAHDIRIDSAKVLERSESKAEGQKGSAVKCSGQTRSAGSTLHDLTTTSSSSDETGLEIDLDELMLSDLHIHQPHTTTGTDTLNGSTRPSLVRQGRASAEQLRRELAEEDDEQDFSVLPYVDRDENEL